VSKQYGLDIPLWQFSKQVFEHNAWGRPESNRWSQLQYRLYAWAQSLYGAQPFERMVLGIGEELGELYEATRDLNEAEYRDAIGDASIFSMQGCMVFRLDFGVLATATNHDKIDLVIYHPLSLIRRLNQITLKTLQGTRGLSMEGAGWQRSREMFATVISDIAWMLDHKCRLRHADYFDVVKEVAEKVLLRTKDLPVITK